MKPVTANEEYEAAKKVLANFLLTRKNYSLYPEGHYVTVNSIEHFCQQLNEYLSKYGDLKLYIEKNKLIFQGETIHSEPPKDGSLPFTLFRDGIRWLEFTRGITTAELKNFLRIINKYSTLSNEPEGDIVTDFWECRLPHINYEAADFFASIDQAATGAVADQSSNTNIRDKQEMIQEEGSGSSPEKPDNNFRSVIDKKLADWKPMTEEVIDQTLISLASDEQAIIQEMVRHEEEEDPTAYLDALLDSMIEHQVKENFETILEIFEEELKSSLTRKDFYITFKILQSIHYIRDNNVARIAWAIPLLDDFLLAVSSSNFLKPLQDNWSDMDSSQFDKLKQFFLLLQPAAVNTIGILLLQTQSLQLREMLIDVITNLSAKDIRPLEFLLVNPDEKIAQSLLPVLINLQEYGEKPLTILMRLIKHKSAAVRRESLKGILKINKVAVQDIFNLIDDQELSIRRLILKSLSQSHDPIAEKLLLDYLEHHKFKSTDGNHEIACFTALGKCGSLLSIPFLRRTLLSRGWMPGIRKSSQRKGAAIALNIMGIKEAQEIIEAAKRSIYPSVRRIVNKTNQEWT